MRYTSLLLYLFIFFIIAACSGIKETNMPVEQSILYPSPPDTARIQFLKSISSSKDIIQKRSAFYEFVVGKEEPKSITKPFGVFIKNGKIYICDTNLGGLVIINLELETFEYFIPSGRGKLKLPLNCFVDSEENLYIADGERRQIVVFDSLHNYVGSFGETENFKPTDVFVYEEGIYLPNPKNNSINIYDKSSLKLINTFPNITKGDDGYLYSPTSIFIKNDVIYVTDFGDFKVKEYTLEGDYISSVGSFGRRLGQFARPKGIAVDNESNLYVVDAGFENIQIFNKDNRLLMFFGGAYKGKGDMWLPAQVYIDYENLKYFDKYVDQSYNLKYLIFVSNQYGPDKINVYGAIEPKK